MGSKITKISSQQMNSISIAAKNIHHLMKTGGVDADELRKATGLGIATINSLRRGEGNPTLSTLVEIAKFFQVSLSELIEGDLSQQAPKIHSIKTMPLINIKDLKKFVTHEVAGLEQYSTEINDCGNKSYFAVLVSNDTLSPQFSTGTILVIGKNEEPCDGDLVLIKTGSNIPCFRKLFIDGEKFLYAPVILQQDTTLSEYNDAEIVGVILKSIKTISGR